jgi:hypothetical protein
MVKDYIGFAREVKHFFPPAGTASYFKVEKGTIHKEPNGHHSHGLHHRFILP